MPNKCCGECVNYFFNEDLYGDGTYVELEGCYEDHDCYREIRYDTPADECPDYASRN